MNNIIKESKRPSNVSVDEEKEIEIVDDVEMEEGDMEDLLGKLTLTKISKGELRCGEVLKEIFGEKHSFVKKRPEWLRYPNTKGRRGLIELDLYCEEMKIAVEYNGRQHYEYMPHFHRKGIEQYYQQVKYDEWKIKRCKEMGIKLFIVSYRVKLDDIRPHLIQQVHIHLNNK